MLPLLLLAVGALVAVAAGRAPVRDVVSTWAAGPDTFAPVTGVAAPALGAPATGVPPRQRPPGLPTPGQEAAGTPLAAPPVVPGNQKAPYRFASTQVDGSSPVAYDPCRPLHYVTRQQGAPAGGDELVAEAVASTAAATGLRLVSDGTTDERPSSKRREYQPERYGDRWAPVLIAWATPVEDPGLAGPAVGQGGSTAYSIAGSPKVLVTGVVTLDAPDLSRMLKSGPAGRAQVRAVIQHELGHVVGLAHVADRRQLMHPESELQTLDYGLGDRLGLAALGRGACVPSL